LSLSQVFELIIIIIFLFQRIFVALQRFNAVPIHESFVTPDVEPDL